MKTKFLLANLLILQIYCFGQWSGSPYKHTRIFSADRMALGNAGSFFNTNGYLFFEDRVVQVEKRDSLGMLIWSQSPFTTTRESEDLVSDGNGGVIIISAFFSNNYIYGSTALQRLDKDGNKLWGADGKVLDASIIGSSWQIIESSDRGYIFIWTKDNGTSPNNVFIQKIDTAGNFLWTAPGIQISSASNEWFEWGVCSSPRNIVSDGKGGAIVTWQRGSAAPSQIICARIDKNGNTVFNKAITTTSLIRNYLSIVSDRVGGAYVLWTFLDPVTFGENAWVQRLDSLGTELFTTNGKELPFPLGGATKFQAVEDLAGGFLACLSNGGVKASNNSLLGNENIFVQRYNNAGNPLWASPTVTTINTKQAKLNQVILPLDKGKYMVAWRQGFLDTAVNTRVQIIDSLGNRLLSDRGNPVDLITPNVMEGGLPITINACSDGKKGAFVAWNMYGTGTQFCSRIYPDGSQASFPPVSNFTVTLPKQCSDTSKTYVFENKTLNGIHYSWDFGDNTQLNTTTGDLIKHTFPVAANYKVKLIAKNAHGADTIQKTIGPVHVAFTFTPDTVKMSAGNVVNFTNSTTGADHYRWTFGNFYSDSVYNPTIAYKKSGIYTVKLKSFNAICSDSLNATVIVKACDKIIDTSYIQAPVNIDICSGDSINIKGKGGLNNYNWYTYRNDTIWSELFTYPDGTTLGPGNPPKWTRHLAQIDPTWGFEVLGNSLSIYGSRNAWLTSEKINISAYEDVSINVTAFTNVNHYSGDSVRVYYQLNDEPETLFSINGRLVQNFPKTICKQNKLTGQYLTIIIRASATSQYKFDDLYVYGKKKIIVSYDSIIKVSPKVPTTYFLEDKLWTCTRDSVTVKSTSSKPIAAISSTNTIICTGDSVKLKATSATGLTYDWYRNNMLVTGAYDSVLYVKKQGAYTVRVSNVCGADTSAALLINEKNCSTVWPGDSNNDSLVDNTDLLPIGLYYAQSGLPRITTGNSWQPYQATNWGMIGSTGYDITHTDCNGDGIIDKNDTLAVNLNFNSIHNFLFLPVKKNESKIDAELYFHTDYNTYHPGDWIDVDVMIGNSSMPVERLYGIAFNCKYDASTIESGSEQLIYSNGWFGTPGSNAITITKINGVSGVAYGAETRINHTNAHGFGKIATLRLQAKTSITSLSKINFSYSGYQAVDSAGENITFIDLPYSITIDPLATSCIDHEKEAINISVYPNPYYEQITILYQLMKRSNVRVEIMNVLGEKVEVLVDDVQAAGVYTYNHRSKGKENQAGFYFVRITVDDKSFIKKIIRTEGY